MCRGLTEDDMRRALGLDVETRPNPPTPQPVPVAAASKPKPKADSRVGSKSKSRSPKLRVTLRVSQEFEGETQLFTHDADTLSRFDAEQQAKK